MGWPQWPRIYRVDYGHSEVKTHMGRDPREYCVMSTDFVDDGSGKVKGINTIRVEWTKSATGGWDMKKLEGTEEYFPADLVLLSMGFLGPEDKVMGGNIEKDARKNIKTPAGHYNTNIEGVFAAGDCRRGQSLIVWGINEGRMAARDVDSFLTGMGTQLLHKANGAPSELIIPRHDRQHSDEQRARCKQVSARRHVVRFEALNDPGNMAEGGKSNELHEGEVTMALLAAFLN